MLNRFSKKKLLIAVLISTVLYAGVGFLLMPVLIKRALENYAGEQSTGELQIDRVHMNPFTLALELSNTSLVDADNEPVFVFERVYINVDISGLLRRSVVVREVDIERPQMSLKHYGTDDTSISRLISGSQVSADDESVVPAVLIKNLNVSEGRLQLIDMTKMPELQTEFRQISFTASGLSTQPGDSADYTLTINDAEGGRLKFAGQLQTGPLVAYGLFEASDIELNTLYPWVSSLAPFLHKLDGKVHFAGEYELSITDDIRSLLLTKTQLAVENLQLQSAELATIQVRHLGLDFNSEIILGDESAKLLVTDAAVQVDNIQLQNADTSVNLLTLDKIQVVDASLDWQNRRVGMSAMSFSGGNAQYTRRQDGLSDWSVLVEKINSMNAGGGSSAAWLVQSDRVEAAGFELSIADLSPAEPVKVVLADIEILISNLDTAPEQRSDFTLKMTLNESASVQAEGWLNPAEVKAGASITVGDVNLAEFAPYLDELTELQLRSGWFNADISAEYDSSSMVIDGNAGGRDVVFVDGVSAEPVLTLDEMKVSGISIKGSPLVASIESLTLQRPYMKVEISPDRDLNLSAWFKSSQQDGIQKSANEQMQVKSSSLAVTQIEINDGLIDFSDNSLSPQLDINIGDLGGALSGFDLDPEHTTSLDLQGRVGEFGSARVTGRLRPLDPARYSEIKMAIRNIPTVQLSTYSARFAGRKIESGKMNLDLTYLVTEGNLDGNHNIELLDLLLGERVESAEALDLPLDMAIALLQDSDGRIDIAIPVSGDLDNPEFDLRAIIGKATGKLVSSIVSAPFKMLGLLAGRSDKEMNSIAFEAGSAAIAPPALETITELSKLLQQRPGLALRALGSYDPMLDRDALARQQMRLHVFLAAGLEPENPARPRPVAFSDPKIQDVLDEFALSRLGKDVQALLAGEESGEGEAKQDDGAVHRDTYYESIFNELVWAEEIPVAKLERVARYRAQSIVDKFERLGVEKSRVYVDDEIRTTESNDSYIVVELIAEPGS